MYFVRVINYCHFLSQAVQVRTHYIGIPVSYIHSTSTILHTQKLELYLTVNAKNTNWFISSVAVPYSR